VVSSKLPTLIPDFIREARSKGVCRFDNPELVDFGVEWVDEKLEASGTRMLPGKQRSPSG
jgi:hypothetical protein